MAMRKTALILLLPILIGMPLCAQSQAVVKELAGKVELQAPKQAWAPARVGMNVTLGSTISTGFNSSAVLELGGSVLRVSPLTRLRIDELIERQGTVKTELFLQVGKVKAEVRTLEGLKQDFTLKSPVSTAAVRGTGFEYTGYDLYVYEGTVTYSNLIGQGRSYSPGENGGTSGYDTPVGGEGGKEDNAGVNPYAPGLGGESRPGLLPGATPIPTGGVIIVVPGTIQPE
jgi:hypothetical protein